MKLKNTVAIVTGASGGIGRAIAHRLAAEGSSVVCSYRSGKEQAEALAEEIRSAGGTADIVKTDVQNYKEVESMVQNVIERFNRIDILVNNAGINRDGLIMSMTPEDWQDVLFTNLTGVFHCIKAVAQQMMFQKRGRIINISSVSGERPGRGQANYAASKGGVNALTRAAAVELAKKNITVNAVAPGVIKTDMSREVLRRAEDIVLEHIPLKRLGTSDEIAKMVVFLASDDASYITGQVFNVDGGFRG